MRRARQNHVGMATELLYLTDAYLRSFTARVVDVDGEQVALERTAFYPTGGGQPHDTGSLAGSPVVEVEELGHGGNVTPGALAPMAR